MGLILVSVGIAVACVVLFGFLMVFLRAVGVDTIVDPANMPINMD